MARSFTFFFMVLLALCLPAQAAALRERDVADFVADQVALRYQVERSKVEIEWMGASLAGLLGTLPVGPISLSIEGKPRLIGRATVPVTVSIGVRRVKTVYPQLDIKVWQDVWVVSQALHRGSMLAEDQVVGAKRSLEAVMGTPVTSLKALQGALAKREVPAGSVLVSEMFELLPLVRDGQLVTVRLKSGDLTIVTRGQVLGSGASGQLVRVINPETHKNYVARVVGVGQVEVNLEEAP